MAISTSRPLTALVAAASLYLGARAVLRDDLNAEGNLQLVAIGGFAGFGAGDVDADQLLRTLAVAHHLQREIEQQRIEAAQR